MRSILGDRVRMTDKVVRRLLPRPVDVRNAFVPLGLHAFNVLHTSNFLIIAVSEV